MRTFYSEKLCRKFFLNNIFYMANVIIIFVYGNFFIRKYYVKNFLNNIFLYDNN